MDIRSSAPRLPPLPSRDGVRPERLGASVPAVRDDVFRAIRRADTLLGGGGGEAKTSEALIRKKYVM